MSIYPDPPRKGGSFAPVLLGWNSLLALGIVAAWLGSASIDAIMAERAPRWPVAAATV
jgi:hypothetical protein